MSVCAGVPILFEFPTPHGGISRMKFTTGTRYARKVEIPQVGRARGNRAVGSGSPRYQAELGDSAL